MNVKRFVAGAAALPMMIVLAAIDPAAGAATSHAAVVVRHDDRHVERMCVAFDEPSISGLELLERAGVPFLAERSAVGSAICRIGDRGCKADDCFCEYPAFWGYWTRSADGDEWTFADVGAADRDVRDGDMDGWSWGKDGKPAPGEIDFGDVCSGAAAVAASSRADASREETTARPNYAAFAGLVLLFALAAVVLLRRRRRI